MKVLITGGTGTISSGIVQECVNRKIETYALTRGSNKSRNITGADYLYADVWNTESVSDAIGNRKYDVVVECLVYNVEQLKISLRNFANICEQYVFVSTAGIYNRQGEKEIREQDEKCFTDWNYTRDKIECERYLIRFCEENALKYTIIRPTVTYGDYRIPFPVATRTPGWTFFQRMLDEKPMLASTNVPFSVIHISDFSNAVVSLFGNREAYNEDFHITSRKNNIYWDDTIRIADSILGTNSKIIHVPVEAFEKIYPQIYDELRFHKNTSQLFDDLKVRTVAKCDAKVSLADGVRNTISAMRTEYEMQELKLDDEWNDLCNATIYYAYKNNLLENEEMILLEKYFLQENIKVEFISSFKRVRNLQKKKCIKRIISKIKSKICK